jgi:hypothetical protein
MARRQLMLGDLPPHAPQTVPPPASGTSTAERRAREAEREAREAARASLEERRREDQRIAEKRKQASVNELRRRLRVAEADVARISAGASFGPPRVKEETEKERITRNVSDLRRKIDAQRIADQHRANLVALESGTPPPELNLAISEVQPAMRASAQPYVLHPAGGGPVRGQRQEGPRQHPHTGSQVSRTPRTRQAYGRKTEHQETVTTATKRRDVSQPLNSNQISSTDSRDVQEESEDEAASDSLRFESLFFSKPRHFSDLDALFGSSPSESKSPDDSGTTFTQAILLGGVTPAGSVPTGEWNSASHMDSITLEGSSKAVADPPSLIGSQSAVPLYPNDTPQSDDASHTAAKCIESGILDAHEAQHAARSPNTVPSSPRISYRRSVSPILRQVGGDYSAYVPKALAASGANVATAGPIEYARYTLALRGGVKLRERQIALKTIRKAMTSKSATTKAAVETSQD